MSIIYDSEKDDLHFENLIGKYVLDKSGKVEIKPQTLDEINSKSIIGIDYVISGRGCFDAWKSNFQKMVRRGNVTGAWTSFLECGNCGGQFLSNIINRLCHTVICEDVGIANMQLCIEACRIFQLYTNNKKLGFSPLLKERCFLLIKNMCIGYKSRLSDNIYHTLKRSGLFDVTTDANVTFSKLGTFIDDKDIDNSVRYVYRLMELSIDGVRLSGYKRVYFLRKKKLLYDVWDMFVRKGEKMKNVLVVMYIHSLEKLFELKDGDDTILLLICGILSLCVDLNKDFDDNTNEYCTESIDYKRDDVWIQDISYDSHTKIGRKLGRDIGFFLRYGCKLDKLHPLLKDLDEKYYRYFVEIISHK
jgi:predicted metal-binding protein